MQEKKLEVFLAVAMSRTFGKAAALLNVTPSTVSRELKELEAEAGMILVDRQKGVKSVRLTPAGEAFLPLVIRWQEARREIDSLMAEKTAFFLNIAGCEAANNILLPELFNDLLSHAPPVHLRIITDPTDKLYEKVESREIDVAFVVHEEPSKLVRTCRVLSDEMFIVRLDERTNASEGVLSPAELPPACELYIEWSLQYRLWHNKIWDPTLSVPVELLTTHLAPHLMLRPGQWTIVPRCAKSHFSDRGKHFNFYRLSTAIPSLSFYKLTHRSPKLSALHGLSILNELLEKRMGVKLDDGV